MPRQNDTGRYRPLVLSLAALMLVATCGESRAAEPYTINAILSLSGLAAFLGKEEQQSLTVEEKLLDKSGGIGGRPIRFEFHDDQSSPQIGVQLFNQIAASQPAAVLGSSLSAVCNAMSPLALNGPVLYCVSPGIHPALGSYSFTGTTSTFDEEIALLRYFRLKGWTRIAVITSTDASGQDGERGIEEAASLPENKDVKLVERQHFNPSDVSVAAQLERIRAAQPQALVAWTTGTPLATVFKAIIQSGIDIPVGTTNGNQTFAQMDRYADFLPKALYMPCPEWLEPPSGVALDPRVAAEHAAFFAAYKEEALTPDGASILAWDLAKIVVDGLRALGPGATAAQLKDHILHLKGYAGVNGIYDFEKTPQRGLDVGDTVVTLWSPKRRAWDMVSEPGGVPIAR